MKISLRKLNESDAENFLLWMKDENILISIMGAESLEEFSEQDIQKCFLKMASSEKDFHKMILLKDKPIGLASLIKDKANDYRLQLIIGDKECWSKGYDLEAIKQMVKEIKENNLKAYLEVNPNSARSIAVFADFGFVPAKNKRYPKDKHFRQTLKMELS